jgi:hypothetical protein
MKINDLVLFDFTMLADKSWKTAHEGLVGIIVGEDTEQESFYVMTDRHGISEIHASYLKAVN